MGFFVGNYSLRSIIRVADLVQLCNKSATLVKELRE
jgi:hypothetical protein